MNIEKHGPTAEPSLEQIKEPKVESLVFANNQILIKTSFFKDGKVSTCYILVKEPNTEREEILRRAERFSGDGYDKENIIDTLNKLEEPIVFKSFEDVKKWFDLSKEVLDKGDLQRLARFLGLSNYDIS